MPRTSVVHRTLSAVALVGLVCTSPAVGEDWPLQTGFPPLIVFDAPDEGAHPLGGPILRFVRTANVALAPFGHQLTYHVSGPIPPRDAEHVLPAVADMERFASIHAAVAAGSPGGGVDIGVGIANENGLSFGELYVAGLPFGLEADEFAAYLFDGGGVALQQQLYDAHFDRSLVVLPVAITPTQGGGWFPEALPDPEADPDLTPEDAMRALCAKPWIVRWPEPGAGIWREACAAVGKPAAEIGPRTRCARADAPCPGSNNPRAVEIDRLSFGGFIPGSAPHVFLVTGNIDAYELNLPSTDVLMIRLATGQDEVSSAQADLRAVIERAPYYYGQTWHQPVTYVELVINRAFWESLTHAERATLRIASESATLRSWTAALSRQGDAIALLMTNGARVGRWPAGLLERLREATDTYLDARAAALAAAGDGDYDRVLTHMRAFQHAQRVYADFGDINQGRAALPTTPH